MRWFKKNFETLRYCNKQVDMGMWIIARVSSAYQISWRVFLKNVTQYKWKALFFSFVTWPLYFKSKSELKYIGEVKEKNETEGMCCFHL